MSSIHDAALERAVRRASYMRQGFYVVVLLVALAGQVSGAVEALDIPLAAAIPAVGALELGGIVVLANADVRRRLGERAIGSRLLSAAIATGAVAFNWLAHDDHLVGGFFAGMSALGYLVWLTHTENQRRDRLRATGDAPPITPAYEVVGHWVRHPLLTRRARALAKAEPNLGLYDSLHAARTQVARERRQRAIAKVLHRKIRSAVDPATADIALAVYDLEEIAARLSDRADYDRLTDLIAVDLLPERLAPASEPASSRPPVPPPSQPAPSATTPSPPAPAAPSPPTVAASSPPAVPASSPPAVAASSPRTAPSAALTEASAEFRVLAAVRRELEELRAPAAEPPRRRPRTATRVDAEPEHPRESGHSRREPEQSRRPQELSRRAAEQSLRKRVHETLDRHATPDGREDHTELVDLVTDKLRLSDIERITASTYVQTWKRDRVPIPQQRS